MKILYVIIIAFIIVLITGFLFEEHYIQSSQINYATTIKHEVNVLMNSKKKMTLELAKDFIFNRQFINILKNRKYKRFYEPNFFHLSDRYKNFNDIGINIMDNDGISRYFSWTHRDVGKSILGYRQDLRIFFKNLKPMKSISVGRFNITFKGIMPIYDKKHHLLGAIEIITHFNSILKALAKNNIYGLVVIEKRFNKQLRYSHLKTCVNGYKVANNNIKPQVEQFLKKYQMAKFINLKNFLNVHFSHKNYMIINVPIYGINHKSIGYFLIFAQDKYHLKEMHDVINIIMVLVAFLFFLMVRLIYKKHKENLDLIKTLNQRVKEQIDKNLKLIYVDRLTGSYKKEKFKIDRFEQMDKFIVMFNIRNFSKINEIYGFEIGDDVLQIVARRVENIIGSKLYRINADEFVFITDSLKKHITEIKQSFIQTPIQIDEPKINLRLSFSFSAIKNDHEDILRRLSIALKQAKTQPFRKFVFYSPSLVNKDFIQINALLYEALFVHKNSTIIPYLQGIRDNQTGEIIKYESLARLKNKDKIYTPYFFINIAKSSGFLFEITRIMIDKSFAILSKMDKNIEISINITEDDLISRRLKGYLLDKLEVYKIDAQRITLEILEGITSTGAKNNIMQLKELKEVGFKLAIDDFGVEYSNFERISELDIDFIKIDGKYIKTIDTSQKSYKIVKAITDFAHSLGIEVVAEFVENESIYNVVKAMNIDYSQGYYFSKPCSSENNS